MGIGYPNSWLTSGANPMVNSDNGKNARVHASDKRNARLPAEIERRDVAPSIPPVTHTERAVVTAQVADWDPVTGQWLGTSHPNTGKHDGGHPGARAANTDQAQGQAWSASGGQFGKQSPRGKAAGNTGSRAADAGALAGDTGPRTSYSGGKGRM